MSQPRFTKTLQGGPALTSIPPFIVTDFNLSKQSNAVFHVIGDDYKVSSFGNKSMLKKINGIMRNPESTFQDMIDYYNDIRIGNNYGSPINFSYLNYSGDGYVTGMALAVQDGSPASVSLDFMELVRYDTATNTTSPLIYRDDQYDKCDNACLLMYGPTSKDAIKATALQMLFSSRYSIANSRKNIIYYGENPTQISLDCIIRDDDGNYAKQYNAMLENLRIAKGRDVLVKIGTKYIAPATVVQVSSIDQSSNSNYVAYSISAMLGT